MLKALILLTTLKLTTSNIYQKKNSTCDLSPEKLGKWYQTHGGYNLILKPLPQYTKLYTENFYNDPLNPPYTQKQDKLYCAVKFITKKIVHPSKYPDNKATSKNVHNSSNRAYHSYILQEFTSEQNAINSGFSITHKGHCGACSSLQDLGVYISKDLTNDTRHCGLIGIYSSSSEKKCLEEIGFSEECASVWAWNILNTKKRCFWICLWHWMKGSPNNNPDGSLNSCIQCDEDKSGPNFKFFSGRTRRNSGLVSEIDRETEEIYEMSHCYFYDLVKNYGGYDKVLDDLEI